jgi:predicted CXXCH cytochrome family protein
LACRDSPFKRVATLVLVLIGGYLLFLLEQVPATAARQNLGGAPARSSGLPSAAPTDSHVADSSVPTSTLTPVVSRARTPVAFSSPGPTVTSLATTTLPVSPTPIAAPTLALTSTVIAPVPATETPASAPTPPRRARSLDSGMLWATAQDCTAGAIVDPENSIDLAFNDLVAWCGPFQGGDSWTYSAFQDTTLGALAQTTLVVRFYVIGLTNDTIALEANNDLGWQPVASFGPGNLPPEILTTLRYDATGTFTNLSQVQAAQIRLVLDAQAVPDPIIVFFDEARLEVIDVLPTSTPFPPLPTPTSPPPEASYPPSAGDPHADYSATTDSCAGCHRTHSAAGLVLRATWPEEDLCFACHAAGGPGTDVQATYASYENTDTRFFKHDVAASSGVHRVGQTEGSDFGDSSRHVECEDCHEPHEARRGPSSAPMLPWEMNGTAGVEPFWIGSGAPSSFTWLPQAEREYQVCFKCHSSFTTPPGYLPDGWDGTAYVADGLPKLTSADPNQVADSRDLARELNPYHASFHPVLTQGRNQSISLESFVNGWSQTSLVYCTDCHTNANSPSEAGGPHGSPLLHILTGQADYTTVFSSGSRMDSGQLCFQCHDYDAYVTGTNEATNFPDHGRHLDNNRGTTCYTCHDTHGSEQLHLINFDASVMSFLDGRNSQTAWYVDSNQQAGCYLICHGKRHDPSTYGTR